MKRVLIAIGALVLLAGSLASCTKKEGCMDMQALNYDADAEVDCCCEYVSSFDLQTEWQAMVGGEALVNGGIYNVFGMDVRFDLAQFYVSNLRLVRADGSEEAVQDYLLVTSDQTEFILEGFEPGDYDMVRFDIGVDSITNHADPSTYPLNHPLGPQFPPMHWSWDAGYIFIRLDATADQDMDGTPETAFQMHLGKDPYLRTVELAFPVQTASGDEPTLAVRVDWAVLFTGVDMAGDLTTHTGDNLALTEIVVENIANMFSLDD